MSSIQPARALAQQLHQLASMAESPGRILGKIDYLNPPTSMTTQMVNSRSARVLSEIDRVKAEFAPFLNTSDGFDAHAALNGAELDVTAGRAALRNGYVVEDDVLRGGDTIVRDASAAGVAGKLFDAAAGRIALAADGLEIGSMNGAELAARLLG